MTKQIILFLLTAPLFATVPIQVNKNTETPMGLWVAVGIFILLLLLAYFTKNPKTDNRSNNSSVEDSNSQQTSEKKELAPARIQHYEYVHKTLKDMFFKDTKGFIKYVLTPKGRLRRLWIELGIDLTEKYDGVEKIESLAISSEAKEFDNILFAVIRLPKPIQSPEAYFIGLIIPRNTSRKARYITLEYGLDDDDNPITFLCEWDKETHLNLGEVDESSLKHFKDTLFKLADVSSDEWDTAIPSYKGDPWMVKLWEWADQHEVSLSDLPRYSQDLIELEILDFSFLDLHNESFPEELSNLIHLNTLDISNNKLQEFPQALCELKKLTQLSLANNQIQSLPSCIVNLKNLVMLNAKDNNLMKVSEKISEMKYLEYLDIAGNPIEKLSEAISNKLKFNQEKSNFHRTIKTDWRTLPLPKEYKTFDLDRAFTHEEMGYATMGRPVHGMNDRWFIYWEKDSLYFHRSDSGDCIAVVHFKKDNNLYKVTKVDMNNNPDQFVADTIGMSYVTEYFDDVLKWKTSRKFTIAEKEVLNEWKFDDD